MNANDKTYRIPSHRMPELRTKLERLNRRAAKIDAAPVALDVTEISEPVLGKDGKPTGRTRLVSIVRFIGAAPVVAGYTFVARVEHTSAGNLLSKAPGEESDLPEAFRTAVATCDHCRTERNRKDTFVLRSENGAYVRVGRNCLADFLRSDVASAIALFSLLSDARDLGADDGGEGGFGGHFDGYATETFIAATVSSMRQTGWVSRAVARDFGKQSTADHVQWILSPIHRDDADAEAKRALRPTDADVAKAKEIIAWALSTTGTSDYEHNLRTACALDSVSGRNVGVVASVVMAYQRATEDKIARERAAKAPSTHFGTVGQRYDLALDVTFVRSLEGRYGVTTLIGMVDAEGRRFKWFASGEQKIETGAHLSLKGTVKAHAEYKGSPETVLARCKVA